MPKNPHANFSPILDGYSGQQPFRYWCQMALPLTYDDSLSYYELLNKVVSYVNNTINDVSTAEDNIEKLSHAYEQLQGYVNNYFDNIDIEDELRNVLDNMAEDGSLDELLDPLVAFRLPLVVGDQLDDVVSEQIGGVVAGQIGDVVEEQLPSLAAEEIPDIVTNWLDDNVSPVGSAVVVDSSLTVPGAAADAKVTGDEISALKTQYVKKNGEDEVTPKNMQIVDTQESKNLLDIEAVTNGYYINKNGVVQPSETMFYSDFIPVEQGENYVFSHRVIASGNIQSSAIRFVACYDENKTLMSSAGSNEEVTQPYEIPSGVYWIKVSSYHYNYWDEYQFEKGSTYTEYHPYGWAINVVKREYLPEKLSELSTEDKTSLVSAINEVNAETETNTEFVDGIRSKIIHHESTNHYNEEAKVIGRLNTEDGSVDPTLTTGSVTDWIPVTPGTVVRTAYVNASNVLTAFSSRFVAYNAEKEYIRGVGMVGSFTVPENGAYVRVGMANSYLVYPTAITFNTLISEYTYEPYFEEYDTFTEDFVTEQTKRQLENLEKHDTPFINNLNTLSGSSVLRVAAPHSKRNYTISFRGKITTFGKLIIGIGKASSYLSGWVEINSTNIYVYTKRGDTEVLAGTYAHGLTFSETINVDIHATSILSCEIILTTVGGLYKTQSNWFGCLGFSFSGFEGRVTAETDGGVFTQCSIVYYCSDYQKEIWGFGDSYFDHWPRIAIENNYDNFAIDGASGRHSSEAWHSLELEVEKRIPKKILWCMGMNDADSESAVNASWKTYYDKLTAFCSAYSIELILCTIPCVPERNNTYKNQIIRESGYRYVDIADAVGGTEAGSTWYDGLLEPNENPTLRVHPTNAGDKVIAARFMVDVPELMQ